jgi:hypothetical protein
MVMNAIRAGFYIEAKYWFIWLFLMVAGERKMPAKKR